jgi:hypothetical protein
VEVLEVAVIVAHVLVPALDVHAPALVVDANIDAM